MKGIMKIKLFCLLWLSTCFLIGSCSNRKNQERGNKDSSANSSKNEHVKERNTSVLKDTACGCGGGMLYKFLDSNTVLVIKFDANNLIKDSIYFFGLPISSGVVEIYIDRYLQKGIIPGYCSDIVFTNALVPTKLSSQSGMIKIKISNYHASSVMKKVRFTSKDGKENFYIKSMEFENVYLHYGG